MWALRCVVAIIQSVPTEHHVLTPTTQECGDLRRGHCRQQPAMMKAWTHIFFHFLNASQWQATLRASVYLCQARWGHYVLKTVLKVVQRQKILISDDKDCNDKIFTFIFYISQNVLERYERERKYAFPPQNKIAVWITLSFVYIFLKLLYSWPKYERKNTFFKKMFLNENICQTLAHFFFF